MDIFFKLVMMKEKDYNLRTHHVKAVREVLEGKGMNVLYLPPYSPDLRTCIHSWKWGDGRGIFQSVKEKSGGILCGFRAFLMRIGLEKLRPDPVFSCEYRF